jgi:hypothetical protein
VCDTGARASSHMNLPVPAFSARIKPSSFGVTLSFVWSCFGGKTPEQLKHGEKKEQTESER